jgi:hypothetical protein
MQLDERKDNGFVMVRRNLMGHVERREMSLTDFGVFCTLLLEADYKTSTWWGSAPALAAKFPDTPLKTLQDAMLRLKRKGYIKYETTRGQRGNFAVYIPKFNAEEAKNEGPLPVFDRALTAHSPRTDRVTLTQCTGTGQALEAKHDQEVTGDSRDGAAHDCISGINSQRTSILTDGFLTAPIQEEQYGQEGQEEKKASLLLSPDAGTPSPAPRMMPQTSASASLPTSPAMPRTKTPASLPAASLRGTIPNPVEQMVAAARRNSPVASNVPAPTVTVPAKSSDPWHPLDFVFGLPKDSSWQDIPVKELRRVVWYHWRDSESDKYWTTAKANISSEDRLAKNIDRMAQQTPEHVYVPGWATMEVRTIDPACQLCKGAGHTTKPHPDYPDRMHASIAYECSCLSPDPKPWRRLYKD